MYAIVATDRQGNVDVAEGKLNVLPYFWNADTLAYEVATVNATTGSGQEVVVTNVVPVSQSGAWAFSLSSGTQTIGTVAQGSQGSSNSPWWVQSVTAAGAGSTTVDVNSISSSTSHLGDVSISSGSVSVSSGVVLGPSTAAIGQISSGSQTIGTVLNASSTATIGNVSVSSGVILGASTAMTGMISSGTQTIGTVVQGSAGSTANAWYVQTAPFSSGAVTRTTVNTSADASLIAANANRKALIIASLSTAQTCAIGLTTATMTTALANVSLYMAPNTQVVFGLPGALPLYQGPVRGINITSTAVAGGVSVTEFT